MRLKLLNNFSSLTLNEKEETNTKKGKSFIRPEDRKLLKEKSLKIHRKIVDCLKASYSLNNRMTICSVAKNTVIGVKKAMAA